jgi:hypothetical protein
VRAPTSAFARTAYLLTGDRHDAEDLVQVALARTANRWTRLDDPEAYARRVLYTRTVSWRRVLRRRRGEMLVGASSDTRLGRAADPDLRIVLAQAPGRLTPSRSDMVLLAGCGGINVQDLFDLPLAGRRGDTPVAVYQAFGAHLDPGDGAEPGALATCRNLLVLDAVARTVVAGLATSATHASRAGGRPRATTRPVHGWKGRGVVFLRGVAPPSSPSSKDNIKQESPKALSAHVFFRNQHFELITSYGTRG